MLGARVGVCRPAAPKQGDDVAWLTKSRFLSGLQCAKRLWFEVHEPLGDRLGDSMPLVNGRAFDTLIHKLQPGLVVPREAKIQAAIDETRDILSRGVPAALYQGAFREGPVAAVVDVLRPMGDAFELVEVKVSTEVKDEHLPDIAFQALVLERARVPVARACIGHVNKHFVLKQSDDYMGLLVEDDVTAQVRALLPTIATQAAASVEVIALRSAPDVVMGGQCEKPYPCPFMERCDPHRDRRPNFPLSILPRGGKAVAQLVSEGYHDLRDVPKERLKSAEHQRIHAATVSGEAIMDRDATAGLRQHVAPFAYLDFETMNFAVPEIIGTRPYEQCPFQWSLHVEQPDGTLHHTSYLEVDHFGDFHTLASRLVEALPKTGAVFVYNKSLEKGVLKLLGRLLPTLAPALDEVMDRLVDLWPITKDAYYHPSMLGSWSLKAVLPAIDPSLGYDGLDEIQAGGAAQLAFMEMREPYTSPERRNELTEKLKKYCERDTYGMVVVRRFLCSL